MVLSSTKSNRISLESIRSGEGGLNEKRKMLLARAPATSDWARLEQGYEGKLRLICHSHPGKEYPSPSDDDLETLIIIGQTESSIVSGMTGIEVEFSV